VDITELRGSERRLRFLSDVGDLLARSFDYEAVLGHVVGSALPLLADFCTLDMLGPKGESRRLEVQFTDIAKQNRLAQPLKAFAPGPAWQTPEAKVLASGKPLLLRDISPEVQRVSRTTTNTRHCLPKRACAHSWWFRCWRAAIHLG